VPEFLSEFRKRNNRRSGVVKNDRDKKERTKDSMVPAFKKNLFIRNLFQEIAEIEKKKN